MKPALKNTLMSLTVLSTGFFVLSSYPAAAGYQKPKSKPVTVKNTGFDQYPLLGELKADVNIAIDLHQTAASLLSERTQLQEYQESIDKYNEIVSRLKQNKKCNIKLLNENYSNGEEVWNKISAYAEDTAAKLLAVASDSLGDKEASAELDKLEKSLDSGDSSSGAENATEEEADCSASDSKYGCVKGKDRGDDKDISTEDIRNEASAMVADDQKEAEDSAKAKEEDEDMNMDEAAAYGKIRWDVGFAILKDIYSSPEAWGTLKKRFSPWVDQKHVYDVYLEKHYSEMESVYNSPDPLTEKTCKSLPTKPKMSSSDSYFPADNYSGKVPAVTVSSTKYNSKTATADDKWCGQTNGYKNKCTRINSGSLYRKHNAYVAELQACKHLLKSGYTEPKMLPPYLPQSPLPPWKEAVYITSVKKQIPEMASDLPDPWYKVTQSIENFTTKGELANLVEKYNETVRYRPDDYDGKTGEIETDSKGMPRIPIPLMTNRIGAYLALTSAEEEQKPIKDRAIASIKEMNENVLSVFQKAGYTFPNPKDFDLRKESDYELALKKMAELQKGKISSAKAKMAELQATFGGKLLPSVQKILEEETITMNALEKDEHFSISVTRDNAPDINSLLLTATADDTANANYKEDLNEQMEEAEKIPPVGCPVL